MRQAASHIATPLIKRRHEVGVVAASGQGEALPFERLEPLRKEGALLGPGVAVGDEALRISGGDAGGEPRW